ncbi:MAG: FHA domain-containing protein [Deltaproteobacteria bacterium]|nr:FHA domain-containing protein [Deltaproteobacteria bacterium]
MTASLDLIALSGPREKERISLFPDQILRIGRSTKGLHLADPLVSLEHAEIEWVTDRYWVVDMGSATGTFIDEVKIGVESKPLLPGSVLRIGESEFLVEVREERSTWAWVVIGVLAVLAVSGIAMLSWSLQTVTYDPLLTWNEPIHLGGGKETRSLRLPVSYLVETGLDHRATAIQRVTDMDADGVDEVWLRHKGGRRVYTFAADGAWRLLGAFPEGCVEREGWIFPDLRCDGAAYHYEAGAYQVSGQEGVVVWTGAGAGAKVARVTSLGGSTLGGFLAERGVLEPIQYLLCEEALPGLPAQVLTASGRMEPLDFGCLQDVQLGGAVAEEFAKERVSAVALTYGGYQALLRDLRAFVAGNSLGVFVGPGRGGVLHAWEASPLRRVGNFRLSFRGPEFYADEVFEGQEDEVVHPWRAGEPGWAAAPPAKVAVLGPGEDTALKGEGCATLRVEAHAPVCTLRRWCFPARTYLQVYEEGCGESRLLGGVPYRGGAFTLRGTHVEVAGWVDNVLSGGRIDVTRTRLAWRLRGASEQSP